MSVMFDDELVKVQYRIKWDEDTRTYYRVPVEGGLWEYWNHETKSWDNGEDKEDLNEKVE